MYSEEIMEIYSEKPNYGLLESKTNSSVKTNPSCGDEFNVDLVIEDGKIKDVGYTDKKNCFVTMLSASVLTEKIKGMKVEDVLKLNKENIDEMIGEKVIETRISCELLPLEAIKKAIGDLKWVF